VVIAERRLIYDVGPVDPCGCRWQVWIENNQLHVGAACDQCQEEIKEVLLTQWPDLTITEAD
jgi:hypothetical protein